MAKKKHAKESIPEAPAPKRFGQWQTISAVLAILLVVAIFTRGFSGGVGAKMGAQAAAEKAVSYLNANVLKGQTASMGEVGDAGSIYTAQLNIGGREYDAFVTKDGRYFFPSGIDLTEPSPSPDGQAPAPSAPPAQQMDMKKLADDDPVKGKADAPVTIVEWSDFQCPFCKSFHDDAYKQIVDQYVKTGKAKFVYRDFPLNIRIHPQAAPAAEASECADDQGKFWEFHDKLFENQASLSAENYKVWAKELGLDTAKFEECVSSAKHKAEVQKDMADGQAAGISGTPGFIINGRLISGARSFDVFKAAIEAELAK